MAIPPVATSLGSQATTAYFASIARSISIPLVVQDASNYVGASIDLSVYQKLLEEFGEQRILFKPEASPLGPNLSKLRDSTGGKARIFEGSGGINLVDCYRRGIVGTMPAWTCWMGSWPCGEPCKTVIRNGSMPCRCRSVL